jgi:phosphoribosylformylglycinamidine synthase
MVGDDDNRERYAYLKTLMYAGNTGYINDCHLRKEEAEPGMIIVQIGGPAFLVGMGGAAGSSQTLGTQDAKLDLNAVQRGNPQKAKLVGNVLRRSTELGPDNPIASIHDQGAGGPCNVITELIEKMGGKVRLYKIKLGDPTMSAVQIWCAEYQERQGLLIRPEKIDLFRQICDEEECDMEELGVVTGDGKIVVYATPEDEAKGKASVDLPIERVVSGLPETVLTDNPTKPYGRPLKIPIGMTAMDALGLILKQVDVGSKGFWVHHVDRSVGGLVAQQQCCGSLQLPVADVAVSALGHFSLKGMASAIGEQPTIMMLNQAAGARMALTEAITNLMWARVTAFEDISFPANYMWPARHPGELCKLYRAAETLCDFSNALGICQDGGKDSSSMAAMLGDQLIKSPETLAIKLYCTIADIIRVLTPDIKRSGKSNLFHIDLANGKRRLGGSAFANALGQPGNECPDMEDADLLKRCFNMMMWLIDKDLVLSGHDTTGDGLAVSLLEMAFAGNCGLNVDVLGNENVFREFYAKEPGAIIEVAKTNVPEVESVFRGCGIPFTRIGETLPSKMISICHRKDRIRGNTDTLRQMWSETSYRYEREQMNPECADAERINTAIGRPPVYELTFEPEIKTPVTRSKKPKVAILREKGTNGEREMAAAFKTVGFITYDVPMKKLISGEKSLDEYDGIVFPGGFSFMDVFGAGKGWALKIRYNPSLQEQFMRFRLNLEKWSLGVCNGDQAMKHLQWLYPDEGEAHTLSVRNLSGMFESRWVNVGIPENNKAKMLTGMGGTKLGVYVANGEGRFWSWGHDAKWYLGKGLVGMQYIDTDGEPAGKGLYPMNPSGSELGIASLVSECGRHLTMMPHPERSYELWQWPWLPEEWKSLKASPWLKMPQNAYDMSTGKL